MKTMDFSKKLLAGLLIMIAAFALDSCKPDPCKDLTCVNGDCIDGTCDCEEGYEGTLCDQKICNDQTCEEGTCNNGTCECDEGFDGPTCGNELIPSVIHIKQIIITDFPADNKGKPWDQDSATAAPDLTVILRTVDGNELFSTLDEKVDAVVGNRYYFDCDVNIGELSNVQEILLYDYDNNSSDDFIDLTTFRIWQEVIGLRFPSESPEVEGDEGKAKFAFTLEYTH